MQEAVSRSSGKMIGQFLFACWWRWHIESLGNCLGEGDKCPSLGAVWVRDEDRPARIGRLGEHGIEWNLSEPGHRAVSPGIDWSRHAAAMEDLDPLTAVRTDEIRHVLDGPKYRDLRLPEGGQHPSSIEARHILRGRHQNDAIETNRLQERRERLTGAWWQIEHYDVGISPVDEREQPADEQPDEGRVVGQEGLLLAGQESQRHDAHAIALEGRHVRFLRRSHGERNDRLPSAGSHAPPYPEHERYVRAVDVGVEQANAIAELGQAEREIDGNRRLADSTFAAGDGEEPVCARGWPRFVHCFVRARVRFARFIRQRHSVRNHP